VLLRLLAAIAKGRADAVAIAALIQHPLLRPGMARTKHLSHARAYERRALRGVVPRPLPGRLPPWPAPRRRETTDDAARARRAVAEAWLAGIEAAIAPLAAALTTGATLAEAVAALRNGAEALTDAGDGPKLWREAAGEGLQQFFAELEAAADAFGEGP